MQFCAYSVHARAFATLSMRFVCCVVRVSHPPESFSVTLHIGDNGLRLKSQCQLVNNALQMRLPLTFRSVLSDLKESVGHAYDLSRNSF